MRGASAKVRRRGQVERPAGERGMMKTKRRKKVRLEKRSIKLSTPSTVMRNVERSANQPTPNFITSEYNE